MNSATPRVANDWHQRATALAFDGRSVIDGRRHVSASGETFDKRSPIDGRLLGPVVRGGALMPVVGDPGGGAVHVLFSQ